MIKLGFRPHRAALKAQVADPQKLFAMLQMIPDQEAAATRPPLGLAIVVDTSGSMSGEKIRQAIAAAHQLVDHPRLEPSDQITVVKFDTTALVVQPLTTIANRGDVHQQIDSLSRYGGGTSMGAGMQHTLRELATVPAEHAKRVIILTDGATSDERVCEQIALQFAAQNTPLIPIGVGDGYNEELLARLADLTQGRPYPLHSVSDLNAILDAEVGSSVREVVTDLRASVASVKGITLDRITRAHPNIAEVELGTPPHRLGNIAAGDYTVFLFEFTAAGIVRPPSRVRLAQLGLAGHVPALGRVDELPLQDLFVTFTTDERATAEVDEEVLHYVQQLNVDKQVQQAMREAGGNPDKARQTLMAARGQTVRLGNAGATRMLDAVLSELDGTGTISAETRKTVRLGAKTQTVAAGGATVLGGGLSEAEIRKMTGV